MRFPSEKVKKNRYVPRSLSLVPRNKHDLTIKNRQFFQMEWADRIFWRGVAAKMLGLFVSHGELGAAGGWFPLGADD